MIKIPLSVRSKRASIALLSGLVLAVMAGCGGGGSGTGSGQGTTGTGGNGGTGGTGGTYPAVTSTVSGSVTDVNGNPLVGSSVAIGALTATTSQFGAYQVANVVIPAGVLQVISQVTASATVNGRAYSGSNTVVVLRGQTNTSDIHVVMSPVAWQGSITGTVVDEKGNPVVAARVVASAPVTDQPYFSNLGAFVAITDQKGAYTLSNLPPLGVSLAGSPPAGGAIGTTPYTVTASAAGHLNQTANITVTSGKATTASFTITSSTTSTALPEVANFFGFSLTTPNTATRAAGTALTAGALNAVRHFVLARHNLLNYRTGDTSRTLRRSVATRSTPSGSTIESDLFWDYQLYNNLLGYDIIRSTGTTADFNSIALLYDPLGDRFTDVDPALTPDTYYYYSVARIDTINYPLNGAEGTAVNAIATEPMQPLSLSAPASGTSQSGAPTFSWAAVPRAAAYQVLVYDRFPNYQSDTDPDGVAPIWPADPANPGASQVSSSSTSTTYTGPALAHGHTYYWTVYAVDSVVQGVSPDVTIGQIYSFTEQ